MSWHIDHLQFLHDMVVLRLLLPDGDPGDVSIDYDRSRLTIHLKPPVRLGDNWAVYVQAIILTHQWEDFGFTLTIGGKTETYDFERIVKKIGEIDDVNPAADAFYATLDLLSKSRRTLTVVDLGGREFPMDLRLPEDVDVRRIVVDIEDDASVDIVGDAHCLSALISAGSVDAIVSVSTFEHLLMPWKVAVEMAKILKPGGAIYVQSHQAEGLHDAPFDYWRFSDQAWSGLFNAHTGFEITETVMSAPATVLPLRRPVKHPLVENAAGYRNSAVAAVKICEPTVDWEVAREDLVDGRYAR